MRLFLGLALAVSLEAQFPAFTIGGTDPVLQTTQGRVLQYTVPVRGGVAPYRFFFSGETTIPGGIVIDAASGVLSTPASTVGNYRVEVCAQDVSKAVVCAPYVVRVGTVGAAAPIVLANARVSNYYDRALEGAQGNSVEFTVFSGSLPPGILLNTFGRLVGSPTAPGAFGFTLRARNTIEGDSELREYVITVDGPVFSSAALPNGFLNVPYTASLSAFGGTAPYTWTILRGPIPAGFGLTADGRVSGTPAFAGPYTFLLRVQDALGSAFDREVTLLIENTPLPLLLTTTALPAGSVGVPYRFVLDAAGGHVPYAWRISSGAFPPGLTLSSVGVISGTPTAAGSSTVQVELRDLTGATKVASYVVSVFAGLTVTSSAALPAGSVGVGYRIVLAAAGGTPPYRWALASGRVPDGLTFSVDGSLGGVPSVPGRFEFITRVTDAAGATATLNAAVAVTGTARPVISQGGIVSAASFAGTAIVPGQIISIFGGAFGPLQVFALDANGRVPSTLAGVRVLFDNVAAPLLFVSPGQLSAIVPYGLSGKTAVDVVVEVAGVASAATRVNVAASAPAIFTADSSGKGTAAALLTQNVITFYVTGEGLLAPLPIDGSVVGTVLPKPVLPVRVFLNGQDAEVLYAGGAPGLVAGVMQVNVKIPEGVSGEAIPIAIRVGTAESQAGVTVRTLP